MTAAAARLDDPIEHSSALGGLLAGLAIGAGAVLIGIAVIGTGGLGAVALAAMVGAGAATGAGIGQPIGSLSFAWVVLFLGVVLVAKVGKLSMRDMSLSLRDLALTLVTSSL